MVYLIQLQRKQHNETYSCQVWFIFRGWISLNRKISLCNCKLYFSREDVFFLKLTKLLWFALNPWVCRFYSFCSRPWASRGTRGWLEHSQKWGSLSSGGAICENYEKYLKLLTLIGISKYNTFRVVKEKVWQKLPIENTNFSLKPKEKS